MGVAIAIGASQLFLPHQSQPALALRPVPIQPSVALTSLPTVVPKAQASRTPRVDATPSIWQVDRVYSTQVTSIASVNQRDPNGLFQVPTPTVTVGAPFTPSPKAYGGRFNSRNRGVVNERQGMTLVPFSVGGVVEPDSVTVASLSLPTLPINTTAAADPFQVLALSQQTEQNLYVAKLLGEVKVLQQQHEPPDKHPSQRSGDVAQKLTSSDSGAKAKASPPQRSRHVEGLLREIEVLRQTAGVVESPVPKLPPAEVSRAAISGEEQSSPYPQPARPIEISKLLEEITLPSVPPLSNPKKYLPVPWNGYIWPARGVLTSGYGWRWGRMHQGIDIAAPLGTPIVAAAPGEVISSSWNSGGYGNLVELRHPDGSLTRYAHNNRLLVRRGQQVDQGQLIAEMGSTGRSTGPHLHFEVHSPGKGAVNPITLLTGRQG